MEHLDFAWHPSGSRNIAVNWDKDGREEKGKELRRGRERSMAMVCPCWETGLKVHRVTSETLLQKSFCQTIRLWHLP